MLWSVRKKNCDLQKDLRTFAQAALSAGKAFPSSCDSHSALTDFLPDQAAKAVPAKIVPASLYLAFCPWGVYCSLILVRC